MTNPAARSASQAKLPGGTVASWLDEAMSVDSRLARLHRVRALAESAQGSHVWIHLCPMATWQLQLATLMQRVGEGGGDEAAAASKRYPLLGVPFAVKDNIDIAGEPTTAACPAFSHVAPAHATVVQRLLDAGAIWVGKTNLDQFATGLVGTRSPYGRPASVADELRISGGSSSGSAVAVARGIVAFSLGTDTAGSGRIPAGFNGLVGLKPTPGRVSTTGVLPACRTLDCVSIFAHTVPDAAHVLAVIEGADAADAYSAFAPGPAQLPARVGSAAGRLRVGVPQSPPLDGSVGYPDAWVGALQHLHAHGHDAVTLDFTALHAVAALLYEGPWVAERHAVVQDLMARQPEALDPTVLQVIARALGMTATDTFKAQYALRTMQAELAALWQQVDVLMVPTARTHPTFAQLDADPIGANAQLGLYTNFVNLLGWSALAVPAGSTSTGLPFGVTFIAPGNCDAALVALGKSWAGLPQAQPAGMRSPAVEASLQLAVVGAHLSGLPLNSQLIERGATLVQATSTAPAYRLFALPGTTPPKPGLMRSSEGGAAIAVEVWAMPLSAVGSFLALIPPPLGLGSIELADGSHVHGFLCEAHALSSAEDITHHGGWRAYMQALKAASGAPPR